MAESVSLAAERAADRLRKWCGRFGPVAEVDALDAARVLLQAYEVTEQEIRDQVEGTPHEQPATVTGPAYLMAVFESLRVASVQRRQPGPEDQP